MIMPGCLFLLVLFFVCVRNSVVQFTTTKKRCECWGKIGEESWPDKWKKQRYRETMERIIKRQQQRQQTSRSTTLGGRLPCSSKGGARPRWNKRPRRPRRLTLLQYYRLPLLGCPLFYIVVETKILVSRRVMMSTDRRSGPRHVFTFIEPSMTSIRSSLPLLTNEKHNH